MKLITLITAAITTTLQADWRTDAQWELLQSWANWNGINLSINPSLKVGMVESPPSGTSNYVFWDTANPANTNAEFSQVSTKTNKSNLSNGVSSHAVEVAKRYFGNTSSVAPGTTKADVYEAYHFINKIVQKQNTIPTPTVDAKILSHSYVIRTSPGTSESTRISLINRINAQADYLAHTQGIFSLAGMDNGSASLPADFWNRGYNNLSVGRTDGNHARGPLSQSITTTYSGPTYFQGAGRQKPEIVINEDKCSKSVGAISSTAALLYNHAKFTMASANAELPMTLKAILLTGATKEEFPSWTNTTSAPLDNIYGAGEANIYYSFRILHSTEQGPGNVSPYGWDHESSLAPNNIKEYVFSIPGHAQSGNLSASLCWNRTATAAGSYHNLNDLSLKLTQISGGTFTSTSDSTNNNLEHIWSTNLSPGTYKLTVTSKATNSGATPFTLAWRSDFILPAGQSGNIASFSAVPVYVDPNNGQDVPPSPENPANSIKSSFVASSLPSTQPIPVFRSYNLIDWHSLPGSYFSDQNGNLILTDLISFDANQPKVFYSLVAP